jgi:hypothetical protein
VLRFGAARACPDAFIAIGALLTTLARPGIVGAVPGFVFEASTQGSGKTLQIHEIAVVATGRPAGVMTYPVGRNGETNQEELEKVLSAYALSGARMIAFDNIWGALGGPALEKCLTSVENIDLRVLGATDLRTMPWSAVTCFSGNNMTMNDDIAQRVLISRLESPREDPRTRPAKDFRHRDLLGAMRDRRAELVRDALTVLRAFFVAEDRERFDCGTWGSFEAWSKIVPPAIRYAGGPNILDARPSPGSLNQDDAADAHVTLMLKWPTDPAGTKARALIEKLFPVQKWNEPKPGPDGLDDLRAAVRVLTKTSETATPTASSLAGVLTKLRGKIRGGLQIVVVSKSRSDTVLWGIRDLTRVQPAAG